MTKTELKQLILEVVLEEKKKRMKNPCWKGYKAYGTKQKDGEEVPNCVPKKKKVKENHDIEEVWSEQSQMQDECWECYEAAMQEGMDEAWEECYRKTNWDMVPEGDEHTCEGDEFYEIYGDFKYDPENIQEAEYRGHKVQLGIPSKGDVKKSKVFVRKPNGNVVKVNFGDPNMRIKRSNPARRKSFNKRHKCSNPGPRWKAKYWSCRAWRKKK